MEKVLEFQRCNIEHGIEKNISIKNIHMQEVISGIIDQTLLNNGCSISFMVVQENSGFKDLSLISDAEFG